MGTLTSATCYKNHRFPVEIISHAVWLYFRFCLSFRDVEELLFKRVVIVTYEAIRKWCRKSGSNPRARPCVSLRPMAPLPSTSARTGIGCPHLPTAKKCERDFRAGARSHVPPWLPRK